MNSTLGTCIPKWKLWFGKEWRQPVAWPWFTGGSRLPKVTNHNIMALQIQIKAQFQTIRKREKERREREGRVPSIILCFVWQLDISASLKEISLLWSLDFLLAKRAERSCRGDMSLKSRCMSVRHYWKIRMGYALKTSLLPGLSVWV